MARSQVASISEFAGVIGAAPADAVALLRGLGVRVTDAHFDRGALRIALVKVGRGVSPLPPDRVQDVLEAGLREVGLSVVGFVREGRTRYALLRAIAHDVDVFSVDWASAEKVRIGAEPLLARLYLADSLHQTRAQFLLGVRSKTKLTLLVTVAEGWVGALLQDELTAIAAKLRSRPRDRDQPFQLAPERGDVIRAWLGSDTRDNLALRTRINRTP